jgi:hypothetical protein
MKRLAPRCACVCTQLLKMGLTTRTFAADFPARRSRRAFGMAAKKARMAHVLIRTMG